MDIKPILDQQRTNHSCFLWVCGGGGDLFCGKHLHLLTLCKTITLWSASVYMCVCKSSEVRGCHDTAAPSPNTGKFGKMRCQICVSDLCQKCQFIIKQTYRNRKKDRKHERLTECWFNVGPPSWSNIKPTLGQRLVFLRFLSFLLHS